MNIHEYIALDPNEKPLDRIVEDGGMCAIFRNIACIGDSLSSGEFEALDNNGNRSYHDLFEYSWGQFIARDCGSRVYNFSRGGMTAKEYWNSVADTKQFTTPFQLEEFKQYVASDACVLDVGCGYGRTLQELYTTGYKNVTGIDFSVGMIERGKKQLLTMLTSAFVHDI